MKWIHEEQWSCCILFHPVRHICHYKKRIVFMDEVIRITNMFSACNPQIHPIITFT